MRWTEPILHVDMDAFFVEVERKADPGLRGKPVVVGGAGPRGVVAAASYEARGFGVHSAMPMSRARRRCPELIVVAPTHGKYREVSEDVFAVFRTFTPLVEGLSLDEAFLDVGGLTRHFESSVVVAQSIRSAIKAETGLPASVGVASNKFLAKLASQAAKPDGIHHLPIERQLEFLHSLDVRSLWGVGEATWAALDHLGVETVGDLALVPPATLNRRLGASHGAHLAQLASGRDPRPVQPDGEAKSISVEETYPTDVSGFAAVDSELLAHADSLASRLRRAGLVARTISIKVRYGDFSTVTRSASAPVGTDVTRDIHRIALGLTQKVELGRPIRLIGVAATNLEPKHAPRQLTVGRAEDWDRMADAVEAIRERFGQASVEPASLLRRRQQN